MHAYGRWRALAPAAPEPVPVRRARAGTRYGLAVLAVDQGDTTAARLLLERNLAILGELGDEAGAAQTYIVLEVVAMLRGEVDTASAAGGGPGLKPGTG